MPKVSRAKKYEFQVKFLTEMMNDPKRSINVRMHACDQLNKIYERLDKYGDNDARRRARKALIARTAEDNGEEPQFPPDLVDDAETIEEERIHDVFANILKPGARATT
jgi:hypothetical protein